MSSSTDQIRTDTDALIQHWVHTACTSDITQRRQQRRFPFFRAACITDHKDGQRNAFSRDISPDGIGLLHSERLAEQEQVTVSVFLNKRQVDLVVRIEWCRPGGHGWFYSGGSFVGLSVRQGASLLMETIGSEVERRLRQRYPFFRTITVSRAGANRHELPIQSRAFSLDISLNGMGILINEPITPQPIVIRTQDLTGRPIDLRAFVLWCQQREHGWYVAGSQFTSLDIMELPAIRG